MVRLFSLHVHDDANVVDVYVICICIYVCINIYDIKCKLFYFVSLPNN